MRDRLRETRFPVGVADALVMHLEGANDASDVVGVDDVRASRIARTKQIVKSFGAELMGELGVRAPLSSFDITRGELHLVERRPDIEPCAAADDRDQARCER